MNRPVYTTSLLILILLSLSSCRKTIVTADMAIDLNRLDDAIANRETFVQIKQNRIDGLKNHLATATTPSERYAGYKRIFDEYLKFDPDSALKYVATCQKIATDNDMKNEYLQSLIDEAMITILQGDYYKAKEKLDSLGDIEDMPLSLQHKAATAFIEFYIRRSAINSGYGGGVSVKEARKYWAIFGKYLEKGHWQTDYYEALMTDHDKRDALLSHLNNLPANPSISAMLKYALALGYYREGKEESGIHYVTHSVVNDIEAASREAQSLVYLINRSLPYIDTNRAYKYVMICTDNAHYYKDMGRSHNIIAAHSSITSEFGKKLQQRSLYLTFIVVLLASAIAIIVWLYLKVMKRRKKENLLLKEKEELNDKLQLMIEQYKLLQHDLVSSNKQLTQHINTRNETFLNVYLLVVKYVKDIQAFKRDIYNYLTVGKIEKAIREVSSTSGLEKYLKEFYAQFDKAFLMAHPDFPQKFNALLKEGSQIVQPSPESLTPELRIYALVSLGFTDSLSIANFLNYSPQTIYNYQLKVRKGACIPEKSFASTIAHFYK